MSNPFKKIKSTSTLIGVKSSIVLLNEILEDIQDFHFAKNNNQSDTITEIIFEILAREANLYEGMQGTLTNTIFDKRNQHQQKEFICHYLILLNAKNGSFLTHSPVLKEKFINLFKDVCSNKKWARSITTPDNKRDDYFRSIQRVISENYKGLFENYPSISKISEINKFENDFYKKLGSAFFKDTVKQFFPENFKKKSLALIFTNIKKFTQEKGVAKIELYKESLDQLEQMVELSEAFGTAYANTFITIPFNQLKEVLENDFQNSPYAKPVNLSASGVSKKFPLHQVKTKINIPIELKKKGESFAKNVVFEVQSNTNEINLLETRHEFKSFDDSSILLNFPAEIKEPIENASIEVSIYWENLNETEDLFVKTLLLKAQRKDINWDELTNQNPYNSEAVDNEEQLVGRDQILNRLFSKLIGNNLSSIFIYGQKRVGKTSIAKTLINKINNEKSDDYICIYTETGEYQTTAGQVQETIDNLSKQICESIIYSDYKEFKIIEDKVPVFNGSFNKITQFLNIVEKAYPQKRIVIVLDEFDEIDPVLYHKGKIGDAFFLTIRAISNKKNVSFVLVGGEKMKIILSSQGEQINKFISQEVDYFERKDYLFDYAQLVSKPIPKFEIENEVIGELYNYTAGNPYFTKIICEQMFEDCKESRDCHVTKREISRAIEKTIENLNTNSFSHFWEDGIKEKEEGEEIKSMNRKKFLLCLTNILRKDNMSCDRDNLITESTKFGLDEPLAESTLNEFMDREIISLSDNGQFYLKVRLFQEWLVRKGAESLITTFSDEERIIQFKKLEEEAKISSQEIVGLIKEWPSYKGRKVSDEHFRAWLNQFESATNQRRIFELIKQIKIYPEDELRDKLNTLYRLIRKKVNQIWDVKLKASGNKDKLIADNISGKQLQRQKHKDLVISYIDGLSKSGAEYAKLFANENNVYQENVVPPEKVINIIKDGGIKAIVFVDDIIGTGKSASENLVSFVKQNADELKKHDISIHFGAITGFIKGKNEIEGALKSYEVESWIYLVDILDDNDKVFSENSKYFKNIHELEATKQIAHTYGYKLEPKAPLGYGDCQCLISFPSTCPNNTLPIIYKSDGKKNWMALFERDL